MEESFYLGNDYKLLIEMTAPGFSMDDDDWDVSIKIGSRTLAKYAKADCIRDDEGNYYALVRGSDMRPGNLDIIFHAYVPDDDWDDGIMNEIDKQSLATIIKP